ncbi:MAG TPA: hypothetical protein VIT91_18045 [Chthoniobacterales bacterium]
MPTSETELHKTLKRLAFGWALENGFQAAGFEISLPQSGFRADVVACKTGRSRGQPVPGISAVFECKQSRADWLRDSFVADSTRQRLLTLNARRTTLERLLRVHHPSAIASDTLFSEFGALNPDALAHDGYRKVLKEISTLQSALFSKTKFDDLSRYGCVNLCYLVTTERLVHDFELPPFWGHLEQIGDSLVLRRQPIWQKTTEANRLVVLQKIAAAWTRQALRKLLPLADKNPQPDNATSRNHSAPIGSLSGADARHSDFPH